MDSGINGKISSYLKLIRQSFSEYEKAYLFGSYVKGKSTNDSDIDLALIFRHLDDSDRFDTQVQLMLLAAKVDSRIEPHPISSSDFKTGNPFVNEIKETGIEI